MPHGESAHGPETGHAHEHEHGGHEHAHGPLGWLKELFVPHSHDSSERVDSALEASRDGMRCLKISFALLMLTAVVQTALVFLTGSVALLGDTLHNYADALTAVPLAIAFVLGRRRATARFTYGYGRAEDLAGILIVVLIAASAALAGYEAIDRLMHPQPVRHLWVLALAGVVGFVGNELVARYRIVVGRRIGSAALVADGLHARTDGFTSLAVVLGAIGVAVGLPVADPVIGLLITVAILYVLRDAGREVYHRLMDGVDPELVQQAVHVVGEVPGVEDVAGVRMRWTGHRLLADVQIRVDGRLPVTEAHVIAHQVEHALVHGVRRLAAATVHVEPDGPEAAGAHELLAHHDRGPH